MIVSGRLRFWRVAAAALLTTGLIVADAPAEIYQWTDASGRVHFTQDIGQVPAGQRRQAEARAARKPEASRIQIYRPPAASAATTRSPGAPGPARIGAGDSGHIYRVQVQRAGNSMQVVVRINGQLDVPFHIDTGASDVVLPQWAAEKLGLDLSSARTGVYGTANGNVEHKLVQLRSVNLQGAEIENVPAAISPSMRFGLLGLSYFNHFKYDIDPVAGIVTLRHNDLAERGLLRGGRSEARWRAQFEAARRRIRSKETQRDEVPFGRTRKREAKQQEVAELELELKRLHREADEARVPFSWRN